jgi:hypothetical protein
MIITTHDIELNPPQEEVLTMAFRKVDVTKNLLKNGIIARFKTFNGQVLQLTIDEYGIIIHTEIED